MIVFGSQRNTTVMGQLPYLCARCRRQASHTLVRSQRWVTLFFIPVLPIGKTTMAQCHLCGYQTLLDHAQADAWFPEAQAGMAGASPSSCQHCAGQGRVHTHRRLLVNLPAGADDGLTVRVIGEGEVAARGGLPGNLYVVLTVKPHPLFKRQGHDIIYELPLSFAQAARGDELEVPTVDGKTTLLTIPAGTQNGRSFRLKGMGVPVMQSHRRGDYHILVKVAASTA